MKMARMLLLVLVAAALGGALAACSSSDNKSTATPTKAAAGSPTATKAAASPTATTAGQAQTIDVTALEFGFHPDGFNVNKGPVTFKVSNGGAVSHTFTVYTDDKYTDPVKGADTGTISSGKSGEFTVTFDKAADFYFHCKIHPTQMQGTITVH